MSVDSNLGKLDLQSQQRYGQLLWQQECLQRFIQNPQRISFLPMDTKSGKVKRILSPLCLQAIRLPQMTSQPVCSIFLCSPLLSGTGRAPGLSIP